MRGHRRAPQISDDEETVEHKLIFAIGRMPGWIAQWYEESKSTKICRPRQVYTGPVERSYQPVGQRS